MEHVRRLLLDNGLADAAELKVIEKKVKQEVDSAVEKAKADAPPPLEEMFSNIYADGLKSQVRGVDSETMTTLP